MRKREYKQKQRDDVMPPTIEWQRYERVKDYLTSHNIYADCDKAHRFFEGKHWGDDAPADMPKPSINFCKGVVKYKVAIVAQNNFQINFSYAKQNSPFDEFANTVCKKISKAITHVWENNNMDTRLWEMFLEAAITGSVGHYSYASDIPGEIDEEIKDTTEILFGDEQERDIQEQPYIILPYRRSVLKIREEAEKNGLSKDLIEQIISDNETENQSGDWAKQEVQNDDEFSKALCLLYLYKKDGTVHMTKSTRTVQFMPEADTKLTRYPIAFMVWEPIKGSARGNGEVLQLINNQVEFNKNFARRAISIMSSAYPKIAYNAEFIKNVEDVTKVGTAIGIEGMNAGKVSDIIGYLNPASQGSDAKLFCEELLTLTKENAGAGDVALGNINPEQASGRAILAVRDASATPLNLQIARAKKFVEDIARIWWDILSLQMTDSLLMNEQEFEGLSAEERERAQALTQQVIADKVKMKVRVDATPTDPYSRYAETASLESYMLADKITFEEFVEALPDNSVIPKDKFQEILGTRQIIMQLQQRVAQLEAEKEQAIATGTAEMQRITELMKKKPPETANSDKNIATAG